MEFGWFPLKQIVRWAARRHGFIDPLEVLAKISSFGQPAEVQQPVELLRAGVILHARGLVNAAVIQHNLDWVWPFWVERQFNPRDRAFIPRSFSITHVNLTHRNWTALGVPGLDSYPLVDPHGLVTPLYDGWSIDCWLLDEAGGGIVPSRESHADQGVVPGDEWGVATSFRRGPLALSSVTQVTGAPEEAMLTLSLAATGPPGSRLVVSVRPYNPEGISFIETLTVGESGRRWTINDRETFTFSDEPTAIFTSTYREGDAYRRVISSTGLECGVSDGSASPVIDRVCPVGLATGAAVFRLSNGERRLTVEVPLPPPARGGASRAGGWRGALGGAAEVNLGDARLNLIYAAAMRTLVLLSPSEIYPGPFTYRRFWFRDAAFMIHGLLSGGITERAAQCIDRFDERRAEDGFLCSQHGEWDSNGAALWAIDRFCALAHREPKREWLALIRGAADWIIRKRTDSGGALRHRGLLPAGFSAEHLGPNDFYFWDDFWAIGGLEAAARLFERVGRPAIAADYVAAGRDLRDAVDRAIREWSTECGVNAIPASPYRRMDAGAIGSIVCAYPLDVIAVDDPFLGGTLEYLLEECCLDNAFFQDMVHSGINPYLSLQLAQVLTRRNDRRAHMFFERIAALASPTGQWPEAIHPATGGGCMGDGHHGWAAAEWVAYTRNLFVREEAGGLLLASGIPREWLIKPRRMAIGPVLTPFGRIWVDVVSDGRVAEVKWRGEWYGSPPVVRVRFLGEPEQRVPAGAQTAAYRLSPPQGALEGVSA